MIIAFIQYPLRDFNMGINISIMHLQKSADNLRQVSQQNIRNSIVRKISSLMNMSATSLTEQISSQLLTKKSAQKIPKQQKNKESARLARERKKLYVSLLKNHVAQLEKRIKKGKSIQLEVQSYLRNLGQLAENRSGPREEIQKYFSSSYNGEASSVAQKMDIILNEIYSLLLPSLQTVSSGLAHLSCSSAQKPSESIKNERQANAHISSPFNPSSLHYTLKNSTPANKIHLQNIILKIQEEINSLDSLFAIAKEKNKEIKNVILTTQISDVPYDVKNQQNNEKHNNNSSLHLLEINSQKILENQIKQKKQEEKINNTQSAKAYLDYLIALKDSSAVYMINEPSTSLLSINQVDGILTRADKFLSTND